MPWLFAEPRQRRRILRHEAVHSLHQHIAPRGESPIDRARAEALAAKGEDPSMTMTPQSFQWPAPALLAFAPQPYSPWTQVWVGYTGIVGEIVSGGVTVRIFLKYDELGLLDKSPHKTYVCGSHDGPPIPDVVVKMQAVAGKAAALNQYIASESAAERVALVYIFSDPDAKDQSGFQMWNGQGAISLSRADFDSNVAEDAIAHEGSHAVFAFHLAGGTSGTGAPNAFALRMAHLYTELEKTNPVPVPTTQFNAAHPPSLAGPNPPGSASIGPKPAGIVMVLDTLWGSPGGHPWDNADEFFASALAGFIQQEARFRQTVAYYETADTRIGPLRQELFELLAIAKNPGQMAQLAGPATTTAASGAIAKVEATPSAVGTMTEEIGEKAWLLEPHKMSSPPPRELRCSPLPTTEELLNSDLP